MKNRLTVKIFSSGMQAVGVQVLGGIFFYVISIYVSKNDFGVINWANAAAAFLTTFLGFGLEQVVVRRISASDRSDWAAAAFFAHAVTGFLITFLLLLVLNSFIKNEAVVYRVLPWFFLAQGLVYIGSPLKLFLNAKERFTPYGLIAMVNNLCKIGAAVLLYFERKLYISSVITILICTAAFELCSLIIYLVINTNFSFKWRFKAYVKLLKESSVQYLSVIFDMSLSKMDWILLGIMTTNVVLADYSFAYRAFEIARLPMLIIAPVILPRLSRLMVSNNSPDALTQKHISSFNRLELFFAMLIPLTLNILWVPVLTFITNGKYGVANQAQFLILSLCIPLQFFINLLWSISFGSKKYRSVTTITIICAVTNIVLNLILIPRLNGLGAAYAFLITTLLQGLLYYRLVRKDILMVSLRPMILFGAAAAIIYVMVVHINVHFLVQLFIALVLYVSIATLSKQITRQHLDNFKNFLSK